MVEMLSRGGVSQWLRGMLGSRNVGVLEDLPWNPAAKAGPEAPNLDTPLNVGPKSLVWNLWFFVVGLHHRLFGVGRWARVYEGGVVHLDKPLRLGLVDGWPGWQRELPGQRKGWGEVPPPKNRGEDVRVCGNQHLRPRAEKAGGHPLAFCGTCWQRLVLGRVEWVKKALVWTLTW